MPWWGQCGIELDVSGASAHDGKHGKQRFFNCALNRGMFVVASSIVENLGSSSQEWLHHKYSVLAQQNVTLKESMRIQTLVGGAGRIRYLGNPGFVDDLMFGVELDQRSPNASDGFVNGKEFFRCEAGKAFFVGTESVVKCLTVEDPELIEAADMELPQLRKKPRMHDRVKLVDGQVGIVCFVGMLESSSERSSIGVKLDQWSANGNDGSAAGKKYFKCEPGHGYFVELEDIASNLGSTISTPFSNDARSKLKQSANLLKVGDKVKLQDGSLGLVKYIGNTHFNEDEMVGIELDQWSPNGHNGKVKGRTYFKAQPGCGTFARRNSVKLLDRGDDALQQITLRDIAENLGRQTTADNKGVSDSDIVRGAHVRLARGKTGFMQVKPSLSLSVETGAFVMQTVGTLAMRAPWTS